MVLKWLKVVPIWEYFPGFQSCAVSFCEEMVLFGLELLPIRRGLVPDQRSLRRTGSTGGGAGLSRDPPAPRRW